MPSRRADWFLLDTLNKVNASPGKIGDDQLTWLAKALDEHADRPALIAMHHNPIFQRDQATRALMDTEELFAVLKPRQQVKAVFLGHSHHWSLSRHDGIHLVNLPPVAYIFITGDPSGWVDMQLADAGATLKFHALDTNHTAHGRHHLGSGLSSGGGGKAGPALSALGARGVAVAGAGWSLAIPQPAVITRGRRIASRGVRVL